MGCGCDVEGEGGPDRELLHLIELRDRARRWYRDEETNDLAALDDIIQDGGLRQWEKQSNALHRFPTS